ncbi:IPT/TIG domain-containing protein [Streptomyces sp. NPDC057291]|uniref:IPT/TIG domain-containing protein n=1 Tax=Streptomyces sp. NPDC057291 TaxID=3346087 RepID=UPI00363B34E0
MCPGVDFGGNKVTPTVTSDSLLSVTVPAGTSGSVGVSVTTAGGANNGFSYTYVDVPAITSLTPTSGSTSGGTGTRGDALKTAASEQRWPRGLPAASPRIRAHRAAGADGRGFRAGE